MKLFPYCLMILLVLSFQEVNACEDCDFKSVVNTRNSLDALNFEIVEGFLGTFDNKCENNIEFLQMSNETLFDVVYNSPGLFLKVLQYGNLDNHDLILEELKHPVHDGINVDVILEKIKSQSDKYMYKYDVLTALK